jgi:hypothetical protein
MIFQYGLPKVAVKWTGTNYLFVEPLPDFPNLGVGDLMSPG